MTCIRTGGVAYLKEYGEWVYGDMHQYDGVLLIRIVFRTSNPKDLAQFGNVRNYTVDRIAEWWDERKTSMQQSSSLISTSGWWKQEGSYEGILEPRLAVSEASGQPAAPPAPAAPVDPL